MCGRYALSCDGAALMQAFGVEETIRWSPRYNVAPTQTVVALAQHRSTLTVLEPHWGLVPKWAADRKGSARLINARAETVAEKPSFRQAFKKGRCLLPATGYYEWVKRGNAKQPYHIRALSGRLLVFAGLWDTWSDANKDPYHSCAIITCGANEDLAGLHHRMPVILTPEDYGTWLEETTATADLLKLLRPAASGLLHPFPVSTFVNSPRNDSPECTQPLAPQAGSGSTP